MHARLQDAYSECVSDECSETGDAGLACGIALPSQFVPICAECMRDTLGGIHKGKEMCDCIIVDQSEKKISLVELKSSTSKKHTIRVLNKAKRQLAGGLEMLVEILRDMGKSDIMLQAVLAKNVQFRSTSAQKAFQRNIKRPIHTKIVLTDCNSPLPSKYHHVKIPTQG